MRGIELIAVVAIGAPVNLVSTGLDCQIDGHAGTASGLRIGLGLGGERVDGIDRHHYSGDTRHAALVYSRDTMPEIIVVSAVDLPVCQFI